MNKAVLVSIQPKRCELIASDKKAVEVRKTKPKLDTPFKCYIYCTKAKDFFSIGGGMYIAADKLYRLPTGEIKFGDGFELAANWAGKYDEDNFLNEKVIGEFVCDKILQFNNGKTIYGWHISDLKIYDKPKELGEFYKYDTTDSEEEKRIYLKKPPQSWCYVEELRV